MSRNGVRASSWWASVSRLLPRSVGRRVRELRDEEGYAILTHRDRADLKLG